MLFFKRQFLSMRNITARYEAVDDSGQKVTYRAQTTPGRMLLMGNYAKTSRCEV